MRFQALLLSLFVCLGCTRALEQPKQASAQAPARGVAIVDASRPKLALDQVQPSEVPAAVEATFRLMPDRRVLTAVADVYELSTGRKESNVTIDFRGGAWQIQCAGQEVGSLPELPTFRAGLDLLTQWSARLRSQRAVANPLPATVLATVDRDIQAFTPPNLFAAVDLIAKQTNGKSLDSAAAARAAHAATLLSAQVFDWFELSDTLSARALALLAIARQGDAHCCAEDEALSSSLLGYAKEAESLASPLPRSTFGAAFILDNPAEAKESGPAFDWLQKRAALRRASLSVPDSIFRGALDVQSAPLLNGVSAFADQAPIARAEESLILREVESNRFNDGQLVFSGNREWFNAYPRLNFEEKSPMQRFDRALPDRIRALQNSILDDDSVRSYYESNFYAAIFKEFAFHQYARYDRDALTTFVASLGKPETEPASQVVAWMNRLSDATFEASRGATKLKLNEDLKLMPLVGGWRRSELLQAWSRAIGSNQLTVRKAAAELYPHLDSRPVETYAAGEISANIISDPQQRDRYISTAVERSPFVTSWGATAWYFFQSGNRAGLRAMLEQAPTMGDRTNALSYLAKLGDLDSVFVHRKFEEILDTTTEIGALSQYAMYLNERGEAATKERFMRRALAKMRDRENPIGVAWVASSLANALDRQGKYDEAYAVIEPHIPVYSGNVLIYAASILQHLGRIDEANQLDAAAVDRYPGVETRAEFAVILWREGRFADAAALFDPAKVGYSVNEAAWTLPERFVETFKDAQPATAAVAAYSALIAARISFEILDRIPEKLLDQHHPELAFALAERLVADPSRAVATNHPESVTALGFGYRALKELKGPDAALAWLEPKIPSAAAMQALLIFYQDGEYDLVQRFASLVAEKNKSNEVATLEAASLLMMRVPQTDVRWQKLNERIRALPDSPSSPPMAKYLADVIDERTFLVAAKSARNHSDIEYFAGLKAISKNDYQRALPMMIGASFGADDYPPTAWALTQLYAWQRAHASWQTIASEHK